MATKKRIAGRTTESIIVDLTEPELLERGARLAKLEEELVQHALKEKSQKTTLKNERELLEKERSRMASIVRNQKENRAVECNLVLDYVTETAMAVRCDTGEVVWDRPMSDQERQTEAFGGGYADA